MWYIYTVGFPGGSAGKESTCNEGDLGSVPGLGRPREKGKATNSSILDWRIPWNVQSTGVTKSWRQLNDSLHIYTMEYYLAIEKNKIMLFAVM